MVSFVFCRLSWWWQNVCVILIIVAIVVVVGGTSMMRSLIIVGDARFERLRKIVWPIFSLVIEDTDQVHSPPLWFGLCTGRKQSRMWECFGQSQSQRQTSVHFFQGAIRWILRIRMCGDQSTQIFQLWRMCSCFSVNKLLKQWNRCSPHLNGMKK